MKAWRTVAGLLTLPVLLAQLAPVTAAQEGYTDVSVEHVLGRLQAAAPPFLLDVRTYEEYTNDGHIRGAVLIPHTELAARSSELPQDNSTEIIVYCRTGSRSRAGADALVDLGYTNVKNMLGGIVEWKAQGYPVEYGDPNLPEENGSGDDLPYTIGMVVGIVGVIVLVVLVIARVVKGKKDVEDVRAERRRSRRK